MFKEAIKPPQVFTYSKDWNTHDFYGKYHLSHIKNEHPVPGTQVLLETLHIDKKKEDTARYEAEVKKREDFNNKRRQLKNESTEVRIQSQSGTLKLHTSLWYKNLFSLCVLYVVIT